MALVHLQKVEFTYPGQSAAVVKIDDFKIEKGESIFLYGPSGCGKSTFLELVSGVLESTSGAVEVLGQDLKKLKPTDKDRFRADHLGYIFQSFNLIPYLSVKQNILLPLGFSERRRKSLEGKVDEELSRLIHELGLQDFVDRKVTQLSLGQQQRVAVARALLGRPEIILADEPTSALDYDHREKFIKLLFKVCEEFGTTVVFVSHDRSLEKLFSRVVSFKDLNKAVMS